MHFLDIITFASYIALTVDVILQIHQVYLSKSSRDISIVGLSIRYLAILIIFYKFFTLGEWPLFLGQLLLTISFTLYLILVIIYYKKPSN